MSFDRTNCLYHNKAYWMQVLTLWLWCIVVALHVMDKQCSASAMQHQHGRQLQTNTSIVYFQVASKMPLPVIDKSFRYTVG